MSKMIIDKFLNFIKELIVLFEDKNKVLYKRLLYYRHRVRNVLDPDVLEERLHMYILRPHVIEMINNRDPRLFNEDLDDDLLNMTIKILWESCTSDNKLIIWKWIQSLLSDFMFEKLK